MKTTVDGVFVEVTNGEMNEDEIRSYIDLFHVKHKGRTLESLSIELDGEYMNVRYKLKPEKFTRLRRITGYLTSSLETWNNAKQAEERDRVKHI